METIEESFGGKVRIRVCGLCYSGAKILLVKHTMNGKPFYAPPGGAVDFGESMLTTLKREFKEETCLNIKPDKLLFTTEYIHHPLHAVEVFFSLETWSGTPCKGKDPEISTYNLIDKVAFYSASDIEQIPHNQLHHVLHNCNNPRDLLQLSGFIKPSSILNK